METTNVYITSESENLTMLTKSAQLTALQKGCDPMQMTWPSDPGEEELRFCINQFRRLIGSCSIFVAIVDEKYGKLRIETPHSPRRVSALHFELLEVCNMRENRPYIIVFALDCRRDSEVQGMLDAAHKYVEKYEADKHLRNILSARLAEYQHDRLTGYLEGLYRVKLSVTCPDRRGLLASVAQVIGDINGSLAGGTQTTKGPFAILHFVAEWPSDVVPTNETIQRLLENALPKEDARIEISRIGAGSPDIETQITFHATFIDQPGIADHIFSHIESQSLSVISTHLETFLSGGMMLGRIRFSLNGDPFSPEAQKILADNLRKLPGVLHVDSTALRGRYWT